MLSNPRHERFAQFLAQGKTASEAYELAGYKPNRANAAQLAHKQHIRDRLTQINASGIGRQTQITAETLIQKAEKVYEGAVDSKQYGAANGAIRGMGVLSGTWIEKKEVGPPNSFDHLTDEELERELVERMRALGLRSDVDGKAGADQPASDAESDTRH